jgi:crotonobetainyl-CoA:carnitine CoA-transferase CaiB-like acyl-CoA transferase
VIGLPDLIEKYPTNAERLADKDDLLSVLRDRFKQRPADDWIADLWAGSIPAGPVNTVDRVVRDPQIVHRKMVVESSRPHPEAGAHPLLGNPVKLDDEMRFDPAPLLGEHSDDIYLGVLGIPLDRLSDLRKASVI